mmetsp:Transcript_8758/g.18156  ORF Transcript_8758/g.18156 Transcript_8758/m.18156 type:complete len:218 (+) Transcript_8758:792-1445(+)
MATARGPRRVLRVRHQRPHTRQRPVPTMSDSLSHSPRPNRRLPRRRSSHKTSTASPTPCPRPRRRPPAPALAPPACGPPSPASPAQASRARANSLKPLASSRSTRTPRGYPGTARTGCSCRRTGSGKTAASPACRRAAIWAAEAPSRRGRRPPTRPRRSCCKWRWWRTCTRAPRTPKRAPSRSCLRGPRCSEWPPGARTHSPPRRAGAAGRATTRRP